MDPTQSEQVTELAGNVDSHLSIIGLFMQADLVVKAVLVLLLFASFWTWAVIFEKVTRLRRLRARGEQFEEAFWSGGSLDDLYERIEDRAHDPLSNVFVAAMREWRRSGQRSLAGGETLRARLQQRVERVMDIAIGHEMAKLERYMVFLASVGSAAPFIGLFGTVWGIMNAFTSIAAAKNTSLAVVAPGIAEALFATALGLLAAIPAVIAYNKFSADSARLAQRFEAFADEFAAIVSRQIDGRT